MLLAHQSRWDHRIKFLPPSRLDWIDPSMIRTVPSASINGSFFRLFYSPPPFLPDRMASTWATWTTWATLPVGNQQTPTIHHHFSDYPSPTHPQGSSRILPHARADASGGVSTGLFFFTYGLYFLEGDENERDRNLHLHFHLLRNRPEALIAG